MYKLINKQTGEEHICQKVTIDGFDYYVSDVHAVSGDFALYAGHITKKMMDTEWTTGDKKVIVTNNPNIDISKVVDEVEELANQKALPHLRAVFIEGYNKSQETHSFSEEDVIDFATFRNGGDVREEFKLWQEQQPKKVYYNE